MAKHKLNEQWVEEIDGKKHMLKAVELTDSDFIDRIAMGEGGTCCICPLYKQCKASGNMEDFCPVGDSSSERSDYDDVFIKDLGILNDDGLLPCPFCGEYPESFNKGNEYTKKRGSVLKCNKCHYELTVCAIYQTTEWCKEKVLYNWNRRA